jgi:hypothetical protein
VTNQERWGEGEVVFYVGGGRGKQWVKEKCDRAGQPSLLICCCARNQILDYFSEEVTVSRSTKYL